MLVYWNNSLWVDMSLHLNTLSWFRTNQSLLLLLSLTYVISKYFAKKEEIFRSEENCYLWWCYQCFLKNYLWLPDKYTMVFCTCKVCLALYCTIIFTFGFITNHTYPFTCKSKFENCSISYKLYFSSVFSVCIIYW